MFQSPKSGKFESNRIKDTMIVSIKNRFNPLDRGNLNQMILIYLPYTLGLRSFNPLNRGNLNQILFMKVKMVVILHMISFNPLDRGNLNQILSEHPNEKVGEMLVSIP